MYRSTFLFYATILMVASTPTAMAQPFSELEKRLDNHPSLIAMDFQYESNQEQAVAATALPDPVVSVGINNFPIFDPSFSTYLPTNKAIGFRQQIPSRAGRAARQSEALAKASHTQILRSARYAELRAELISSLHELRRIEKQRELATQRDAKYDELVDVIEGEIDAGRPSVFRLAEIDGERAEVARTLIELEGQTAKIHARLIDLVGEVPQTVAPDVTAAIWSGEAMKFHQVRISASITDITETDVEKAKAAWKPNWGAQLTYQQRNQGNGNIGSNFDGDDWVSGMVTFSLPIWSDKKQAPQLRAAKARRSAAQQQHMAVARAVLAQYSTLSAQLKTSEDNIKVHEQNIQAIEEAISSKMISYESGNGTYAPIIDGEIAILKLRASIVAEQSRLAVNSARINALLVKS